MSLSSCDLEGSVRHGRSPRASVCGKPRVRPALFFASFRVMFCVSLRHHPRHSPLAFRPAIEPLMESDVNAGSGSNPPPAERGKQLRREKTKALRARYLELFGEESKSSNQALCFGGLHGDCRLVGRRLESASARPRHRPGRGRRSSAAGSRKFWRELAAAPPGPVRDPRLPAVGTTLQRRYRDRTIIVKIVADGFEYDGKIYESLVQSHRW